MVKLLVFITCDYTGMLVAPESARHFDCANGLRILCLPDATAPLAVLRTCLFAGSRFDPPGRQGLAHLCEHLLCQGAWEEQPDLQERVVAAGGTTNGRIYPDRICFGESLPSSALRLGLEVAAQRLAAPMNGFSPERLQRERDVLLQERREREAMPLVLETEALHRLLFPRGDPYRGPPGGNADGIARLTLRDVQGFVERHVAAGRAVLAVAGDLEPETVAQWAEEVLGGLEPGPAPHPGPAAPPAPARPRGAPRAPGRRGAGARGVGARGLGPDARGELNGRRGRCWPRT
jgi:zinc protease